jgi:hypothetical protein
MSGLLSAGLNGRDKGRSLMGQERHNTKPVVGVLLAMGRKVPKGDLPLPGFPKKVLGPLWSPPARATTEPGRGRCLSEISR